MAVSTEVKVGFVFFLGLAMLAIFTIMVGQGELRLRRTSYSIDVLFSDAGGLRKNDSVELGGMEVGKVESLKAEGGKIRVRLRIDEGVEIKKGSKISIVEKSLLGGKLVSITMGPPEEETISPGTTLTGEFISGTTELIATLADIAEKSEITFLELQKAVPELTSALEALNRITKSIQEGKGMVGKLISDEEIAENFVKILDAMEKMGPKMDSTLESMDTIMKRIEEGKGTLGKLVTGEEIGERLEKILEGMEEVGPKMTSTLESMDRIMKRIEEGKGTIGKLLTDEKMGERLDKVLEGMGDIGPKMTSTLDSMERIMHRIEKGEGTLGKLVTDETLYEDASETLKSARVAGERIAQFTDRLEQVKTYIGIDSAYNEDNSHTLTKIYLSIQPRPHKLYLVGVSALTGPGTEWDEKDEADLELDLQLGRRFLDNRLTGRIGLFETRIGAGIDYAFNNRLSLFLEGRNAWTKEKDEGIEPFLLRGRLQYRIWRGFYIHAGADNILDETALNAGIRLEYSDEDIKYILSTLSISR